MAKVVTDNKYYSEIADAIRALTETSNTYTPAQMAPAILGYIAGGIDLSELESYFVVPVINAMRYIQNLGTDDWVHYVIMTDSHYSALNYMHSGAIVKSLMGSGYFDKFIHLGDMVENASETNFQGAVDQIGDLNGQMLFCIGNHDIQIVDGFSLGNFYTEFMSDLETGITWNANLNTETFANPYYVYKNDDKKIAFIHFSAMNVASSNLATEVSWFYDVIETIPDDYTVFVMGHYPYSSGNSTIKTALSTQFMLFPTRLKKGLYLAGHLHADQHNVQNDGFLEEILFAADCNKSGDSTVKQQGTETEQLITLLSVGTGTNNLIKTYRIGAYNANLAICQNMPYFPDMTITRNEDTYATTGNIGTTGQISTGTTMHLKTAFIPVNPSTYYYIYNPDSPRTGTTFINCAEYSRERVDTFVSNSRQNKNNQGALEANVFKIYTRPTSNYLLLATATSYDPNDFIVTDEIPALDISIDEITWVSGSINISGIPESNTSRMRSNCPISVKPSTQYRLTCSDATLTSFFIGYEKGPCMSLAVNSTRDNISRATVNNGATFTTPSNCLYIMISYAGTTVTEGTWTLEEVTA